jgi:hypothetical protein
MDIADIRVALLRKIGYRDGVAQGNGKFPRPRGATTLREGKGSPLRYIVSWYREQAIDQKLEEKINKNQKLEGKPCRLGQENSLGTYLLCTLKSEVKSCIAKCVARQHHAERTPSARSSDQPRQATKNWYRRNNS